jgi:hypothetical protein
VVYKTDDGTNDRVVDRSMCRYIRTEDRTKNRRGQETEDSIGEDRGQIEE